MLAIIIDIRVLLVAFRNSSIELFSNHVLRLASHDVLLLPGDLLLSIFPCRIHWRSSYLFLFRIICPKYWSFLHLTVIINSFSFLILRSTSTLVIFSVHDILKILLYNYSSNASNLFEVALVKVQVSAPYKRVENTYHLSRRICNCMDRLWLLNWTHWIKYTSAFSNSTLSDYHI